MRIAWIQKSFIEAQIVKVTNDKTLGLSGVKTRPSKVQKARQNDQIMVRSLYDWLSLIGLIMSEKSLTTLSPASAKINPFQNFTITSQEYEQNNF